MAQNPNYMFDFITNDDGLASNNIITIYEDSFDFMWFGTLDGLNRFDGMSHKVYRNNHTNPYSISNNAICCIVEEPKTKNLWIGTGEGLNYFNRGTQKFTRHIHDTLRSSISNDYIYCLCYDSENNLWIGTKNGLNAYINGKFESYHIKLPLETETKGLDNANHIKSILADSTFLWIGTGESVYTFDLKSRSFTQSSLPSNVYDVNFINKDSKNNLWFNSYTNGLFILDNNTNTINHLNKLCKCKSTIKPQGIVEDEKGNILIADRDVGLGVYNPKDSTYETLSPSKHNTHSLNSKALTYIYKSKIGIVWIGTYNSGINFHDQRTKDFNLFNVDFSKTGLHNENVRSVFEDSENNIWIGTKENGCLSLFHKDSGTFTHYKQNLENPDALHGDYLLTINELDKDHLIIGTLKHGINIFNKKTGKATHIKHNPNDANSIISNTIYSVFPVNENERLVATLEGLDVWYVKENRFKHIEGPINGRCFYKTDDDKIWFGTYWSGIYVYDSDYNILEKYSHDFYDGNSLGSNDVSSIKEDSKGRIWICTRGGGLNYYVPEGNNFRRITEKEGLANNYTCDILFHNDKQYWISTGKGLSVYNPIEKTFKNYDKADGLQGNEFGDKTALKSSSGELLFGGRNGFNFFRPEKIIDNTQKPKVILTEFYIHNKEVTIGPNSPLKQSIEIAKKITLSHEEFIFSFGFAAINHLSPSKNKFLYKLEGFENEWVAVTGKPFVTYTNIPSGKYTFRVKASNNDGYWNEEGTSIQLIILPPWWKTLWFRILIFIAILSLSTLLYYQRFRSLTARRNELEVLVRKRTNEQEQTLTELRATQSQLIQSEKMSSLGVLIAGVAHEINNPLNFVQTGIYAIEDILPNEISDAETKETVDVILSGMQSGISRISNIVKTLNTFSRKDNDNDRPSNIHEIIDNCLLILNHEIKKSCFVQKNYCTEKFNFIGNDGKLHQVFTNIIMNALQALKEHGKITIETQLSSSNDNIEITITDNGAGIPKENLDKIFDPFFTTKDPGKGTGLGLSIVFNIIAEHKGTINYQTEVNKGTAVKITLPIKTT